MTKLNCVNIDQSNASGTAGFVNGMLISWLW